MDKKRPTSPQSENSEKHPWDFHKFTQEDRKRIKQFRDDNHLGYTGFGKLLGLHGTTVKKWECGEILSCSPKHFRILVSLLRGYAVSGSTTTLDEFERIKWRCQLLILTCFKEIGEAYRILRPIRRETRRLVRHIRSALAENIRSCQDITLDTLFSELLPSAKITPKKTENAFVFNGEINSVTSALVRRLREDLDIDHRDISEVIHVNVYSVKNWERCSTKRCRNSNIEQLDALLNHRYDALLIDHHHYVSAKLNVPMMLPANLKNMLKQALERSDELVFSKSSMAEFISRFVKIMHEASDWTQKQSE